MSRRRLPRRSEYIRCIELKLCLRPRSRLDPASVSRSGLSQPRIVSSAARLKIVAAQRPDPSPFESGSWSSSSIGTTDHHIGISHGTGIGSPNSREGLGECQAASYERRNTVGLEIAHPPASQANWFAFVLMLTDSAQGTSSAARRGESNATITCASARMPGTRTSSRPTPSTSPSTGKRAAAAHSLSSP